MNTSEIFQVVNTVILIPWIVLIFFPKKKWKNPAIHSFAVLMSLLYSYHVLADIASFDPSAFNSLEGIKAIFTKDEALLAGWIHYLVFDLLVGNWIVNQSIKYGIKHYLIIPCLFFTFMFGPLGYLLFFSVRTFKTKSLA